MFQSIKNNYSLQSVIIPLNDIFCDDVYCIMSRDNSFVLMISDKEVKPIQTDFGEMFYINGRWIMYQDIKSFAMIKKLGDDFNPLTFRMDECTGAR